MPAERRTSGLSVEEEESARFLMPAQNPAHINRIENEVTSQNYEALMKDTITVECQKLNGKIFTGTVNYSEAKMKVFQEGLDLDANLLGSVKIMQTIILDHAFTYELLFIKSIFLKC